MVFLDTNINIDEGSTEWNDMTGDIEASMNDPEIKWHVAITHHQWVGPSSNHPK